MVEWNGGLGWTGMVEWGQRSLHMCTIISVAIVMGARKSI